MTIAFIIICLLLALGFLFAEPARSKHEKPTHQYNERGPLCKRCAVPMQMREHCKDYQCPNCLEFKGPQDFAMRDRSIQKPF